MPGWLRKRQVPNEEEDILNYALRLAILYYLQPIEEQLHERYPGLGEAELERDVQLCEEIAKVGIDEVHKLAMKKGTLLKLGDLKPTMIAECEWISDDNVMRLINKGIYMTFH